MHLTTTLLLPTLASALTTPWLTLTCHPGNPGAVYYCSNNHFSGSCTYRLPDDSCFAPPTPPHSIGPDNGGYCVLFEDRECKGHIIRIEGKVDGVNRVVCPGIMMWPKDSPEVGSWKCHAGT